jgi:hypothetical protein
MRGECYPTKVSLSGRSRAKGVVSYRFRLKNVERHVTTEVRFLSVVTEPVVFLALNQQPGHEGPWPAWRLARSWWLFIFRFKRREENSVEGCFPVSGNYRFKPG